MQKLAIKDPMRSNVRKEMMRAELALADIGASGIPHVCDDSPMMRGLVGASTRTFDDWKARYVATKCLEKRFGKPAAAYLMKRMVSGDTKVGATPFAFYTDTDDELVRQGDYLDESLFYEDPFKTFAPADTAF